MARLAVGCLCRICGRIGGTGMSNITTKYRRLREFSLRLSTVFTRSQAEFSCPGLLMQAVQLLEILCKLQVGLRYSLEVLNSQANISIGVPAFMTFALGLELG